MEYTLITVVHICVIKTLSYKNAPKDTYSGLPNTSPFTCRTNTKKTILEHKHDKTFQLALKGLRKIVWNMSSTWKWEILDSIVGNIIKKLKNKKITPAILKS